MKIIRGDIIYVELGQHVKSSVQSGLRPCIVVSNNKANRESKTLCAVPCTSRLGKQNIPTHVLITRSDVFGYLERDSVALAEQITTVDKSKVISKVGHLNEKCMELVDKAVYRQIFELLA